MERGFMGLPRGAKDLLPPAARRRRTLSRALVGAFERWGYAQVVTPTLEYYDVLARGLSEADRRQCVRFIEAQSGELVALRADLTPQIARMVAGHRGAAWPADAVTRLCYAAAVVRQPSGDREQAEHHQVGVEMVGDADPSADAELIGLAHEALTGAGLTGFRFDVSHRAVARGVIDGLRLDPAAAATVHRLLARKDRGSVVQFLSQQGSEPAAIDRAAALCDLFGPAPVLDRADAILTDPSSALGLAQLRQVLSTLSTLYPDAAASVDADLGEVRGFDYYTGLRLRVWAPGVDRPVLRGGRYDDLLGRYGDPSPATGFAIDLDALEAALPRDGGTEALHNHVIAIDPAADPKQGRLEAARQAGRARARGERAWVQPAVALARAQELAATWGAAALTFVAARDGRVVTISFRHGAAGWAKESQA